MKIPTKKALRVLTGKSPKQLPPGYNKNLAEFDLSRLAKDFGFFPQLKTPSCFFIFVTKGGVLKSSLTLNMARMAAWHGIKTLVMGLDVQCDISRGLGGFSEDEGASLNEAINFEDQALGLYNFYQGQTSLKKLIQSTDLPHLDFICETPELATLEQALHLRPRREYWLKEAIVDPLKSEYDLILIDGAPSWSLLTTNALVASEALISPVECKINNFRNLNMFQSFINDFKKDFRIDFPHVFVPTRLATNRRLSQDIFEKYKSELPHCTTTAIKDSVQGEEASALKISSCEHQPASASAKEMRQCLFECLEKVAHATTPSPQQKLQREEDHVAQP